MLNSLCSSLRNSYVVLKRRWQSIELLLRRIVNGEVSGVVRRGRRKGDEKKDKKEDASGVALEHRTEGLECPKCGKKYNTRKGGWYDKHLRECIVVNELVGLDGGSDGDGGGKS